MITKIAEISALGPPGGPRDSQGRPEASREPFWNNFGPMLDKVWSYFEQMLQPFWAILGSNLEQFESPAPSPFGRSCYLLALPLLLPLCPRFSGSAGARVSAYNLHQIRLMETIFVHSVFFEIDLKI